MVEFLLSVDSVSRIETINLFLAPCLSPDETFSVLIQKGCFDVSLKLARSFHLPRKPIFEALAMRLASRVEDEQTNEHPFLADVPKNQQKRQRKKI